MRATFRPVRPPSHIRVRHLRFGRINSRRASIIRMTADASSSTREAQRAVGRLAPAVRTAETMNTPGTIQSPQQILSAAQLPVSALNRCRAFDDDGPRDRAVELPQVRDVTELVWSPCTKNFGFRSRVRAT
jgi:hypothetical protein